MNVVKMPNRMSWAQNYASVILINTSSLILTLILQYLMAIWYIFEKIFLQEGNNLCQKTCFLTNVYKNFFLNFLRPRKIFISVKYFFLWVASSGLYSAIHVTLLIYSWFSIRFCRSHGLFSQVKRLRPLTRQFLWMEM